MSNAKTIVLAALVAAFARPPAWAQVDAREQSPAVAGAEHQRTVPLRVAVEAAWQRATAVRESEGQRQRAEAERVAASSLWAAPPSIVLGYRDDRWQTDAGQREAEAALTWPLWLPGQRAARNAAAESGLELADHAERAARLRVAGQVREAAWALLALQAELAQAESQLQTLQRLEDDVERRVRAGDLARAEALAARADRLSATARQAEARQRLLEARGHWVVLTGQDALPSDEEPAPRATAAETAGATPPNPELSLASKATEHARRRVELTRASRRDPPELALGVRQDVPGRGGPTGNSVTFGLRVPFGTDDRNQPLMAAALSELDVAESREQRLRDRLSADDSTARAAVQSAEQQLGAEQERATLLRQRAQLIDQSFRAGESPLPDLLRALVAAAEAEAAVARQKAALGLARARLLQSLGILP